MANARIGVVNYGLGNLRSVAGALERLGCEAVVSSDHDELASCAKLILPGVGAFGDAMQRLRERGLVETLNELVLARNTPVLGICLGFQLMAKESCEFGCHKGLGWLDAEVVRIDTPSQLRLPHVGWNDLIQVQQTVLFDGLPSDALFYYVHTYCVRCNDPSICYGETEYEVRLTAVAIRDNVYGTQFHPEKSQQWGLHLLNNFLEKA